MANMSEKIYNEKRSADRGSFGYEIFYKSVKTGTISPPHFHDVVEIIYVKSGEFSAFANAAEDRICSGSLLLFRSREIHKLIAVSAENTEYYCIKIDPAILRDSFRSDSDHGYFLPFITGKTSNRMLFDGTDDVTRDIFSNADRLVDEFCKDEYAREISLYSKCIEFLISFLRYWKLYGEIEAHPGISASAVYKALEYIQLHYGENITAFDCSQYVALSYSQFSRTFKKVFGMGFPMYLNTQRCSFAEKLLLTTDMRVSEISESCGFSDTAYFIKQFKLRYGIPPAKYRGLIGKTAG